MEDLSIYNIFLEEEGDQSGTLLTMAGTEHLGITVAKVEEEPETQKAILFKN